MKRNILLFFLVTSLTAMAAERNMEELKRIATEHFNTETGVKAMVGTVVSTSIPECVYESEALAIFEPLGQESFVVLSKSDHTSPIVGYAQGHFDFDSASPNFKWYLSVVQRNIQYAEDNNIDLNKERLTGARAGVETFVTTHWHQSDPYNLKAPNNYPAGCVAIALAQSINYCRYPSQVNFRGYYYYTESDNSTRYKVDSLDIKGIYFYPYLDTYGRATEGQKKSVATLIRDCGYATYMQYSKKGSGTYNYLAGIALTETFGYPEECIKYAERISFHGTQDDWNEIIYKEMYLRSPVIFGGQSEEDGGHAFVLCGLNSDGLVWVNWGWGGDGDGYYDIALMNPNGMSFADRQDMVYGIRPTALDSDKPEPRIYSYDGEPYTFSIAKETDDDAQQHIAIHIRLNAGMVNMTPCTFDGEFGLFGTDITEGTNWQIIDTDPATWSPGVGYFLREPADLFYYYVEKELIPGHTYRLSFGSRDNREGQWHSLLCDGGEIGYDILYTGDPATCTISEVKEVLYDGIRDINADHRSSTIADDGMTRVYDSAGRLVHASPTTQFNIWNVQAHGVLIVKQGDKVQKIVR